MFRYRYYLLLLLLPRRALFSKKIAHSIYHPLSTHPSSSSSSLPRGFYLVKAALLQNDIKDATSVGINEEVACIFCNILRLRSSVSIWSPGSLKGSNLTGFFAFCLKGLQAQSANFCFQRFLLHQHDHL